MEFQGTLIKKLEEKSGVSARGNWHRQDVIFEMMDGAYARKVAVTFFNKPDEVKSLVEGAKYNVAFNVESREYNDRWYTDIRAWRVTPAEAADVAAAPVAQAQAAPAVAPTTNYATQAPAAPAASTADDVDDLPF